MNKTFRIGTAGWCIPARLGPLFPAQGGHLERYAARFNCVEINSSFYSHHQPKTYARWASSVPEDFRFSVKLSKTLTHGGKLESSRAELQRSLEGPAELGQKWDALLVQLPPKLEFNLRQTRKFLVTLRKFYAGWTVWEPRHVSWETRDATELLKDFNVTPVDADPPRCHPHVPSRDIYLRLHGTPVVYRSLYGVRSLKQYAKKLESAAAGRWCIFDNTTFGHALINAVELQTELRIVDRSRLGRRFKMLRAEFEARTVPS